MFHLPSLYPITDQQRSGLPHSEQVRLLAAGGARFVQLRDKDSSPREFQLEAIRAMTVARQFGVRIIINDRVDVALAVEADGVHLGQDDMPPRAARLLLGEESLIGLSTHNLQQAIDAAAEPVDYLALGPIFTTSSKSDTAPPVGLDGLTSVRQAIGRKPLVAIGGITVCNAQAVLRAGADSLAVISALFEDSNQISNTVQAFLALTTFPIRG
ncbi:MAG TPA: thiamine phosphate synthase [Pyrinomonadaceae bacterium]|nr:thiamine phosphate synthase [Pyrinomonadaceae bacterium]